MLVKKKNSAWKPSENPNIKVGETMDITNPRQLIVEKMVVAVDVEGNELDAFDLYDEVDPALVAELRAYKAEKAEEAVNERLEAEKAELKKEIDELKKSNPKKFLAAELEAMSWTELRKTAKAALLVE